MNSATPALRVLHLGSDPNDSALLAAELETERIPCRVVPVSSENELLQALESGPAALVIADLPLPWDDAAARLAELQRTNPECPVLFRSGSVGHRTVSDSAAPTARAVREALQRGGAPSPDEHRRTIERLVRDKEVHLRLARRDLWDFEDALREITLRGAELLDVGRVSVWEVDEATSNLGCILVYDRATGRHTDGARLELPARYVAALEAAMFIAADDARNDPRTSEFKATYLEPHGITSMLDAPVRRDGRIVGVICHEHTGPLRHWTIPDQCSAVALADIVARALEVRDRRRAEARLRESEKFEVVGRLAGRLAHDFNNLLTVILGNAQLALQRPSVTATERETLDQIVKASEDATGLIRQLLAYSRREVRPPAVIDVRAEVAETLPMVERLVGRSVNVSADLGQEPLWAKVDPTQLQQMVLNLAANAGDAMPRGGELTVSLARERAAPGARGAPDRSHVRLRVKDSGVGIEPENLPKIFEPFFTTKEARLGTGLGLASVVDIARRAGGEVRVASRPGSGSTFDVLLPEAAPQEASSPAPLCLPSGATQNLETALVVEADPALRRRLARTLGERGTSVLEAGGPVEALELLARGERFDWVATGQTLPKMDGARLIRHLRDFRPNLPAMLLVDPGSAPEAELEALRKGGPTELCAKPLSDAAVRASHDQLRAGRARTPTRR